MSKGSYLWICPYQMHSLVSFERYWASGTMERDGWGGWGTWLLAAAAAYVCGGAGLSAAGQPVPGAAGQGTSLWAPEGGGGWVEAGFAWEEQAGRWEELGKRQRRRRQGS